MSTASPSRPTVLTATLLVWTALWALLATSTCPAGEPPGPTPDERAASEEGSPWLAEVRNQRRAWEAQRQAAREAIDARRRWQDPWAAAQYEAREQAVQQRRDERLEQIDRDRERFHRLVPWSMAPPGLWPPEATGEFERPDPPSPGYPPPGWDNGWYYRGY